MMDKAGGKNAHPGAEEMEEGTRTQEMEEKIRILEMDMDRLERKAKSDDRYLRIMAALWVAVAIMNTYASSRVQANNRTLIKMEQEYTAVHKEHDTLIKELISTHEEMDRQLGEVIQSLKEKYDIEDEEAER